MHWNSAIWSDASAREDPSLLIASVLAIILFIDVIALSVWPKPYHSPPFSYVGPNPPQLSTESVAELLLGGPAGGLVLLRRAEIARLHPGSPPAALLPGLSSGLLVTSPGAGALGPGQPGSPASTPPATSTGSLSGITPGLSTGTPATTLPGSAPTGLPNVPLPTVPTTAAPFGGTGTTLPLGITTTSLPAGNLPGVTTLPGVTNPLGVTTTSLPVSITTLGVTTVSAPAVTVPAVTTTSVPLSTSTVTTIPLASSGGTSALGVTVTTVPLTTTTTVTIPALKLG